MNRFVLIDIKNEYVYYEFRRKRLRTSHISLIIKQLIL